MAELVMNATYPAVQAQRPLRTRMSWFLIGSLTLAVIAALALGMGLDWIP